MRDRVKSGRLRLILLAVWGGLALFPFAPVYSAPEKAAPVNAGKPAEKQSEPGKAGQGKQAGQDTRPEHEYIAIVGGEKIPHEEYRAMLGVGMRQKFYHGKVPEAELAKFRREVADSLIDRVLLLREAKRRSITPDPKKVGELLAKSEKQYADNPYWKENRGTLYPKLKQKFEEDDLLRQVELQVRNIPEPSDKDVRAYYKEHPEVFTTPEKIHVAMILLKVDPSSPADEWRKTEEKAAALVQKLRKGGNFAETARINSGDVSAKDGGDLGYIHKGMLGTAAQDVLDVMKQGDISEPVLLLEGVGIFRMADRSKPKLNSFEDSAKRAHDLLMRERREGAREELVKRLRASTTIKLNEKAL